MPCKTSVIWYLNTFVINKNYKLNIANIMSQQCLLIFIKNPVRGKVKTRLARTVGENEALKIYEQLLHITRENTALLRGVTRHIFYSDFIPQKDEWHNDLYIKQLQKGEDLGKRMYEAFNTCWHTASRFVIIGADCPTLLPQILNDAFEALTQNDFVVGAAADGGYYLLGIRKIGDTPPPQYLFQNIAWSTPQVLETTLQRITLAQKTVYMLPILHDIDEEKDWHLFLQSNKVLNP
jgi:hypothetical protein